MFCPSCKAEYRQGITLCADCNVALLPLSPSASDSGEQDMPVGSLISVWAGEDLALHDKLLEELDAAGIRFFDRPLGGNPSAPRTDLLLLERIPRFGFEVFVLSSQSASAKKILEKLLEEEPEVVELPAAEVPADENESNSPVQTDEQPTFEVWSGTDPNMAEFLEVAFRENEMLIRIEKSGEQVRIFVQPRNRQRAREILREIIEAAPPA